MECVAVLHGSGGFGGPPSAVGPRCMPNIAIFDPIIKNLRMVYKGSNALFVAKFLGYKHGIWISDNLRSQIWDLKQ